MPVQRIFDAGLALAATLLCWYAASEAPMPPAAGLHEPVGLTVLAAATIGLPLAVRRRWPLSVTAIVTVATALSLATSLVPDYASIGPILATGVALYAVAVEVHGRRGVVALAVSVLVVAGSLWIAGDSADGLGVATAAVALGACWLVGYTLRERRAHAVRAVEQATARAVAEERLRIAREIHDIVGHSLAVIAVKSAVGSHVAEQRPAEAAAALDVIASASRSALAELRRAVGALRTEPDFAPAPTLAELQRLADRAVAAGVAVQLEVRGDCDVPDGVALDAVRIVQEALTNVVKHAGPTTCRVDVLGVPGELRVEITDDGPSGRRPPDVTPSHQPNDATPSHPANEATPSHPANDKTPTHRPNDATPSHRPNDGGVRRRADANGAGWSPGRRPNADGTGLIGMRERVAMHTGALTAGPREDGGFQVLAVLPYERVA